MDKRASEVCHTFFGSDRQFEECGLAWDAGHPHRALLICVSHGDYLYCPVVGRLRVFIVFPSLEPSPSMLVYEEHIQLCKAHSTYESLVDMMSLVFLYLRPLLAGVR